MELLQHQLRKNFSKKKFHFLQEREKILLYIAREIRQGRHSGMQSGALPFFGVNYGNYNFST